MYLQSHSRPLVVVPVVAPVVEHVVEDAGPAQHLAPGPVGHAYIRVHM